MYLVVTRSFPPEIGGMQNLMWGLANELSKNYMIKVFADYNNNHKIFDEKVSFSIERVGGMKLLRKYRKAQLINEYIKENKVEGIIADHWKSLEHLKTNKKKICLIHGKEINHEKGTLLNKRMLEVLNNIEIIIANSQYTKDLAIKLGVKENRIIVINPGIDEAQELNKKTSGKVESLLKHKSPRLITVSRFDKRKNHEKIIMALRNLKQIYPGIVYICVGYGEEEKNIKKLVSELGLQPQVMFFKDISNELKNALVDKSNIFVMPSTVHKKSVEGFGIAYVEAAQYGVPSLGGRDGGAADAIEHKKTGLICDGNSLDDIYSSINSMLENKKYIEYGKAAKEQSNKFKWNKIIEEYKKILS
ncbi:phosphatidylinositol alpha-1,6-mannosyltransferase [Candidatus Pelagibacter ubique]|uniref:Phosphatidylinositol alpha-1,6-mannosyltransferase n=1 Tax=Pelagibacter ubique TaxID=198252 RepID=A0ABX1T5M5_PELUQ|nr:glycosyltransferase family 4 protein [Candidatus Pelagibacter ubique]NMN68151.1 phosphatidylinositol alpha-1,6-mannosyltransferase [Candidatus Pelagibacter ubique]